MKNYLLCAILIVNGYLSVAQNADTVTSIPKDWIKGGIISLNFAQSSFTNWAMGGQNALSVASLLNTFANYKKDKNTWDNSLVLAFGMLQSGHGALQKNEDKIDISSKYGRYAYDHWYYSALVNFKSQFANGYNYPNDSVVISHFLAPGYVLGAIGMDYKTTDNSFSCFISPFYYTLRLEL